MSKNYAALAQQIVAAIGGVDNVAAVTHCMTRLRFVVKDDEQVDSSTLKGLAGVLGVVRSDNQCQVIIGNTVSQAYREVVNLLPGDLRPAEPQGKAPLTLKRIGAGILDALIGTMSPLIPAIIGGSMVKLLAMILEMSGALPKGSPTLTLLALIGDGAFFFLPLMVAASAAVKFKTNMSLAIAIAGVLVHPGFIELMAKAAQGEHVEFAFIPVTAVKYTYTVIPALVMTWCLSYIERWVDRITPAVTKNFLKPMLIVLIAAPLAILLIGPLGIWIGSAISRAGVYDPQLSGLVVGGDHGRAVAAVGDDRYAPRLYADHHSDHRRNRQRGYGDAVGDRRQPVARRLFAGGGVENQKPGAAPDGAGRRGIGDSGRDFRTGAVRRGGAPEAPADRQFNQRLYLRRGGRHCRTGQPFDGGAGAVYQRAVFRSGQSNDHRLGVWRDGAVGGAVVCPDADPWL